MAPNTDLATRALVVALKAGLYDRPVRTQDVTAITGLQERTINRIYAKAIERGFDPAVRPVQLLNKHLEDAPR